MKSEHTVEKEAALRDESDLSRQLKRYDRLDVFVPIGVGLLVALSLVFLSSPIYEARDLRLTLVSGVIVAISYGAGVLVLKALRKNRRFHRLYAGDYPCPYCDDVDCDFECEKSKERWNYNKWSRG